MSVKTRSYARKPFYVDAIRVTAENMAEISAWVMGEVKVSQDDGRAFIQVNVHRPVNDRQSQAYVGDWLLSSKNGFKVYTNQAFRKAFDETDTTEKTHRTSTDLVAKHGKPVPGDRRKRSRQPEIWVQDIDADRAQEAADEAAVVGEETPEVDTTMVQPQAVVDEAKHTNRREWLEKNEGNLNSKAQQELDALRNAENPTDDTKEN